MTIDEATLVLDHARPQTAETDKQFYDDEDLNNAKEMDDFLQFALLHDNKDDLKIIITKGYN